MRSKHGHRAFNTRIYERIYQEFKDYVEGSCTRFRSGANVTESFFAMYYYLSTGRKYNGKFSTKYLAFDNRRNLIHFFNKGCDAQSVCFNNNNGDDILIMSCMDKKFPNRSKYEKAASA